MTIKPTVLRLSGLLSVTELLRPTNDNLGKGITVTPFVLESVDGKPVMEIEIRVTRIGKVRVPRTGKSLPSRKP